MSIISKAIEKELKEQRQARKLSGVEDVPGASPPPKVVALIQERSGRERPPERPRAARPEAVVGIKSVAAALPSGFGRQFFLLGGMLAVVAVGVGFFMADTLTSDAPVSSRTSSDPALPRHSAAGASEPVSEPASAPPVQTPLVVRVEVAVKSEGTGREPTLIPVDRQTLFEATPPPVRQSRVAEPEPDLDIPEPPEPPPAAPPSRPSKPSIEDIRARFKVDGIFYGDGDPMTIINDEIVREGSEGSGFTVVRIKPDSVVIRVDGSEYELR